MQLENVITVPAAPDRVWDYLLDVEQVVQCMPGATLTDVVDETTWRGNVSISLGPLTLSYAGEVRMTERDDHVHRAALRAEGTETRGNGQARAGVSFTLVPADGGSTRLVTVTDLDLSGPAAQYGQGMISAVTKQLSKQFAGCLASKLQSSNATALPSLPATAATSEAAAVSPTVDASAVARTAKPVAGLRLIVGALWSAFLHTVRRAWRWVRTRARSEH